MSNYEHVLMRSSHKIVYNTRHEFENLTAQDAAQGRCYGTPGTCLRDTLRGTHIYAGRTGLSYGTHFNVSLRPARLFLWQEFKEHEFKGYVTSS